MLTQEKVQTWIDAMKSGKYKFTVGELKKSGCNCALGVYYELFAPETLKSQVEEPENIKNDRIEDVYLWLSREFNGGLELRDVWNANDSSLSNLTGYEKVFPVLEKKFHELPKTETAAP